MGRIWGTGTFIRPMYDRAGGPREPVVALNVPAGQWHRVYAKESGTVLMEAKNGKWEPLGGRGYTHFIV